MKGNFLKKIIMFIFPSDIYKERACNTYGWVCSDESSKYKGESKSLETTWAKYKKRYKNNNHSKRGKNRATHCIMDRLINKSREWEFLHWSILKIWTYSIHNNDCVIYRVSKYCKHRCNKECIYLKFRKKNEVTM